METRYCCCALITVAQTQIKGTWKRVTASQTKSAKQFPHIEYARVPTVACARLLIVTPSNVAESAPVIILKVVAAAVSLPTANRPIAGYTLNTELLRNCCNLS